MRWIKNYASFIVLPYHFSCFVWTLDVSFVFDIQAIQPTENMANIFLSASISNEDNITSSFTQQLIFNQRNIVFYVHNYLQRPAATI